MNSRSEWPYVLNSRTGRAIFKQRYKERLIELRPLLWVELLAWGMLGLAFGSWRTAVIGYLVSIPVLWALPLWGVYIRMKREQHDVLLRLGVPEDRL